MGNEVNLGAKKTQVLTVQILTLYFLMYSYLPCITPRGEVRGLEGRKGEGRGGEGGGEGRRGEERRGEKRRGEEREGVNSYAFWQPQNN